MGREKSPSLGEKLKRRGERSARGSLEKADPPKRLGGAMREKRRGDIIDSRRHAGLLLLRLSRAFLCGQSLPNAKAFKFYQKLGQMAGDGIDVGDISLPFVEKPKFDRRKRKLGAQKSVKGGNWQQPRDSERSAPAGTDPSLLQKWKANSAFRSAIRVRYSSQYWRISEKRCKMCKFSK